MMDVPHSVSCSHAAHKLNFIPYDDSTTVAVSSSGGYTMRTNYTFKLNVGRGLN